jgi:hypothetical protein
MARYYRETRGWDRGPHLYVVSGSVDLAQDGVWQLTPLNERGIHAASFNATHWGIEIVGAFDRVGPLMDTAALSLGATATLLDWAALPTSAVNGHRDDPTTDKTCPGTAFDLVIARRGIAALRG